jgi:hypothetical protein
MDFLGDSTNVPQTTSHKKELETKETEQSVKEDDQSDSVYKSANDKKYTTANQNPSLN